MNMPNIIFPSDCDQCEITDTCESFHYGDEDCKYKEEITEKNRELTNKT